MVEAAGQEVDRITNPPTKALSVDRIRCFNQGLAGSTEHSDTNRGCLVSTRSLQSHQLFRATGSILSTQGIQQDLESHDSPALDGQLHSSDLCKPERRHLLSELVPTSHFHMGVVPRQEHQIGSRASPGTSQYSSGCRIKNSERSLRLDVKPSGVSEDHDPIGPGGGRPVCLQINQATSHFYSWRPDPDAEAMDAFLQDWLKTRRFTNPLWCLIHCCLSKVKAESARLVIVVPLWKTQS